MGCDSGVQEIKDDVQLNEEIVENKIIKGNNMSSTLVNRKMPEFKMEAFNAATGHYTEVSDADYKDKWTVVCFYPADFTFVCPTEIAAMNAKKPEFDKLGVDILAVSTDTKYSHKRFVETEPLLKGLQLMMGADSKGDTTRAFGVMIEEAGLALRGRFLFNPEGICVAQEVQAPMVGRNVNEFLRQVQAWQYATKTGEVCPAGWVPGGKTLPVNTDTEQMTGRVGDYITIEEITK